MCLRQKKARGILELVLAECKFDMHSIEVLLVFIILKGKVVDYHCSDTVSRKSTK